MASKGYISITGTPTQTKTPTQSHTPTSSKTQTPTQTATPAISSTQTPTKQPTPTPTPTTTFTRTPTQTKTQTPTQTGTPANLTIKFFKGPFTDPDNPQDDAGSTEGKWTYCATGDEDGKPEFVGSSFADGESLKIKTVIAKEDGTFEDGPTVETFSYNNISERIYIDGSEEAWDGDGIICPEESQQNVITLIFSSVGKFENTVKIPFVVERPVLDPPVTPSTTPTKTPTITPSMTKTQTPTMSLSKTPAITPSMTCSPSISMSQTPTETPPITPTPSVTVSLSPSEFHSYVMIIDCSEDTMLVVETVNEEVIRLKEENGNDYAQGRIVTCPTPTPSATI